MPGTFGFGGVSRTLYSKEGFRRILYEPSGNRVLVKRKTEQIWVEAEEMPDEPCGHRCLVVVSGRTSAGSYRVCKEVINDQRVE